jgi:hypothetical protein
MTMQIPRTMPEHQEISVSASVGRRLQPKEPRTLRLGKDPSVTCFEDGAMSNRVADGMQMQCTTV